MKNITSLFIITMLLGFANNSALFAGNGPVPWDIIGHICWKGVEAYQAWDKAGKKATDTSYENEQKGQCPELLATELNAWACAVDKKIAHTEAKFSYTSDKAALEDCQQIMGLADWSGLLRKYAQTYCGTKTSYQSINSGNSMVDQKCTYEYHLGNSAYRFTLTATAL